MEKIKIPSALLSRSIAEVLPSEDIFRGALGSGKKLRIYTGADATASQLHLGHSTNFILLEKLRRLGHEVIVLFGDFTAMIGDPTDKTAARVRLTKEQVEENIASWKDQIGHVLDFDAVENPARIVRNSEWLAPLDLSGIIDLASHFTVQQMLERDMFEKRISDEKPIFLHEFLYPLLQGYDSYQLDVDVEIGGTDQTFNMLAGRTLQRKLRNREKFVITTTLLEDPRTGRKLMSKSEGGYVALNDVPQEMFGKIMALPDEVIIQIFIDCTLVSIEDIDTMNQDLKGGTLNPRDAKLRLAKDIVRMYHDGAAADEAEQYFIDTFSKRLMPEEVAPLRVTIGSRLIDVIAESGLAESRGDAKRKLEQGGVELAGERITDVQHSLTEKDIAQILRVGKKEFRRLVL